MAARVRERRERKKAEKEAREHLPPADVSEEKRAQMVAAMREYTAKFGRPDLMAKIGRRMEPDRNGHDPDTDIEW
jgi:plasmid stability protein